MKLNEIYKTSDKTNISIEIFPPKMPDFDKKLDKLVSELNCLKKNINPALVSVTYGAGGTSKENSNRVVKHLKEVFNFNIMPHLTCVCSNRNFIENYLKELGSFKIENILALRGDEPNDIEVCYKDFKFAYELVEFIKQRMNCQIAVAGYPEGHIDALDIDSDIKNLKLKIEKGASAIFTQLFFDNNFLYRYLEKLDYYGINTPVAAGILPVVSFDGLIKMSKLSGAAIPKEAYNFFEKYKDSKEDTVKAGIEWSSRQVSDLISNDVKNIHFYTLNKAHSTLEVIKNTGIALQHQNT